MPNPEKQSRSLIGMSFANFVHATIIYFTGIVGLLIARAFKGNWSKGMWTYIPIFWVPILTSWPISLYVLFGGLD